MHYFEWLLLREFELWDMLSIRITIIASILESADSKDHRPASNGSNQDFRSPEKCHKGEGEWDLNQVQTKDKGRVNGNNMLEDEGQ